MRTIATKFGAFRKDLSRWQVNLPGGCRRARAKAAVRRHINLDDDSSQAVESSKIKVLSNRDALFLKSFNSDSYISTTMSFRLVAFNKVHTSVLFKARVGMSRALAKLTTSAIRSLVGKSE